MLKQGLYEQVVNTEIKDELRQLPEGSKHVEKIDAAESSAVLTQYLSEVVHIWTSDSGEVSSQDEQAGSRIRKALYENNSSGRRSHS